MTIERDNKPDPTGGTLVTRTLIFVRPDLLMKCPPEVQKLIMLIHEGVSLQSHARHEEGRQKIQEALEIK